MACAIVPPTTRILSSPDGLLSLLTPPFPLLLLLFLLLFLLLWCSFPTPQVPRPPLGRGPADHAQLRRGVGPALPLQALPRAPQAEAHGPRARTRTRPQVTRQRRASTSKVLRTARLRFFKMSCWGWGSNAQPFSSLVFTQSLRTLPSFFLGLFSLSLSLGVFFSLSAFLSFPPNSREALSTWFCELHNMVNEDTGKAHKHDCTPFALDLQYLKDCGGSQRPLILTCNLERVVCLSLWDFKAPPGVLVCGPH